MKDVIEFLNIANMAQLTAIPGIQTSLAESLIAARPYGAKADVLKVKGIGPSMFARIEAAAQEVESDQEIEEIKADKTITVPAYDQPLKMYEPEPPKPKQTGAFRRFMRAFFRVLLWLVVIAGIIGAAGAAFYYGLPYIQRTFIDPLNANTAQIEAIASQQAEDLTALDEKIAALETQVSQFENDLTARDERIAQLESDLADLEESTLAGQDTLSAQLREETVIAFSLELIDRARLYLSQSNFGLARTDILVARERLAGLVDEAGQARQVQLNNVIDRLDMAGNLLPDYPVIAANDLEIAWLLLIEETP